MIVSIHQPNYIPYLGVFYKMWKSDSFIFLDDCQYSNEGMHNWNYIKTPKGKIPLKIPVEQHLGDKINEVRTRDELGWKEKHLKTIKMNYSKCPHFAEIYRDYELFLSYGYSNIAEMNIAMSIYFAKMLGMKTRFYTSSEMNVEGAKEDRVINLVKLVDGDCYYSGNGASVYQNYDDFKSEGIELVYTDYKPVVYPQRWKNAGFVENLSIIDYLFNEGYKNPFV